MKTTIAIPIRIGSREFAHHLENFHYCAVAAGLLVAADKDLEVIVVDYGSAEQWQNEIRAMTVLAGLRPMRVEAEQWSRGRALNMALGVATGDLFLPVDADTILPADYVTAHRAAATAGHYSVSLVYYTKSGVAKSHNARLLRETQPGEILQCGYSHCGLPTAWLQSVGGYDDRYYGWGGEDDDLLRRARKAGLTLVHAKTTPVHLFHEHWLSVARRTGEVDVDAMLKQTRAWYEEGSK